MRPVLTDGHRRWVPGNRWDLVVDEVAPTPTASVAIVVPYFEQPASLRRLYGALAASSLPSRCELIVVDDGSVDPPPAPPGDLAVPVRRVRQDDLGCRPGAARNRAAAATDAEVLVFLDADTLPALDAVTRLAAWPATLPDALVVGRRHHVDLTGWTPSATVDWLRGAGAPPPRAPDPAWLQAGYDDTGNLLRADRRSYRYVISAVMSCSRALFDDIGGFAAARHEYGGDDWELAHRAWVHGAVLVHDPGAVGWHDEPDWQQRTGAPRGGKNLESMWLSAMVPEPVTRGAGLRHARPDLVVRLDVPPGTSTTGQLVATVDALLRAAPDSLVLLPDAAPPRVVAHTAHDPRVRPSAAGVDVGAARAQLVVRRTGSWAPEGLAGLLDDASDGDAVAIEVVDRGTCVASLHPARSSGRLRRAVGLGARTEVLHALARRLEVDAAAVGFVPFDDEVDLAAELGGWAAH